MRRGRVIIYLVLIISLLGVGGYVVYQRFLKSPSEPETTIQVTAIPDTEIVVVTQNVPMGMPLTEDVLGTILLPRTAVIQGMFDDRGLVVGRLAKFDLTSGVILTASMIVNEASELPTRGSVAASLIPKGQVALTIPINRLSSVAYALKSGDDVIVIASMPFVDLDSNFQTLLPNFSALVYGSVTSVPFGEGGEGLVAPILSAQVVGGGGAPMGRAEDVSNIEDLFYVIPSESQRARLAAHIIIPRARVLYLGEFPWDKEEVDEIGLAPSPTPVPEGQQPGNITQQSEQESPEPVPPDIITLIVTPQEAVNLTYLLNSGVGLTLALRSAGDDTVIDTKTVTMQYFLDDYSIPLPAKQPYGFAPRLDEVELPVEKVPTPIPQQ